MEASPRFRPDLEPFTHDEGDGEPVVVLKDPISDRFFRLSPHEHLFLRTCDGSRTVTQARAALARNGHFVSEQEALVVLHSDGVTERWSLREHPGLSRRSPIVVAATLLRDAGVRRDDAGVVVVRHD